jgi:MFS family permease
MLPQETKNVLLIALIAMLRMFGLFALLPVISIFASELQYSSPILIGLSVGAYGLTQAVLQIPFGYLSDRIGRKPVIIFGLLIFISGCAIAAYSNTIYGLIAGRLLQGAGAISATLSALLSDVTRDEVRTKSMAIFGVGIGASFLLSLIIGPVISSYFGTKSLFIISIFMSLISIFVLMNIPSKEITNHHKPVKIVNLLKKNLILHDLNIFFLHQVLTIIFVIFPFMMIDVFYISAGDHWKYYILSLCISLVLVAPLIMNDDKKEKKMNLIIPILLLLSSQFILFLFEPSSSLLLMSLTIFFIAFNYMEATLPSRVSILSGKNIRGFSLGIFSSFQFFGAFTGGIIGGVLIGTFGYAEAHNFLIILIVFWVLIMIGNRKYL